MRTTFRSAIGIMGGMIGLLGACSLSAQTFAEQLNAAEQNAVGLDKLTPAERTALFEAIERYKETGAAAAVAQAQSQAEAEQEAAVEAASTAAVEEYKNREEPGVIARAMELFKREEAEKEQVRFTSVLRGKFRGWEGNTTFYLENGQVWRQSNPRDRYYPKAATEVPVVVYKSKTGYFRLQILDDKGAWVTVKRIR